MTVSRAGSLGRSRSRREASTTRRFAQEASAGFERCCLAKISGAMEGKRLGDSGWEEIKVWKARGRSLFTFNEKWVADRKQGSNTADLGGSTAQLDRTRAQRSSGICENDGWLAQVQLRYGVASYRLLRRGYWVAGSMTSGRFESCYINYGVKAPATDHTTADPAWDWEASDNGTPKTGGRNTPSDGAGDSFWD